jgi:oligoendopeptidase F
MTTTTDPDLTAADVAWDLEPLVDGKGEAGVDALLDQAELVAASVAERRGAVAQLDAAGLAAVMRDLAAIAELIGRAASYAHLRFAADTTDPARGALLQRVEERSTAVNTKILFFDLEWAALPDEQVAELLADDQLMFCRHYLAAARRYRPHLLTEPEELVMTEKAVTGRSAWSRLFSEVTSTITVDLDGATVSLEEALSRLTSPDRVH